MANPLGKTRKVDEPYLTIVHGSNLEVMAGVAWTYKVLRAYAGDPDKPYARWFVSVDSPYVKGELGDTYIADITGRVTQRDPSVPDSALPKHLRPAA